ncbi:glycerophosphodiester phosphodiesterase family protein [Luteolibacter soli]|uniref:Glycerophosphodiester phosphodiesterase family protein n=1 Tax=Luteolibacter soli TaxID=3135280 RepID=A0ABU9AQB6_9BACT
MAFWLTITTVSSDGASVAEIIARFHDSEDLHVLVTAHRGGYLSTSGAILPENSLTAIARSIDHGADILEVDLRSTSDGHLVIMHDDTVSRTTNGSGTVSSMTLAQIKALRLLGPDGKPTTQQVPTFAEVMALAKGKAMVNLDKLEVTDPASMAAALNILRTTGTVNQAIFKGSAPATSVKAALASYPDQIQYMPVLTDSTAAAVVAMLDELHPPAVELIFASATTPMLAPEVIAKAKETGTRIWINSLWASLNGGHHDDLAIAGNPDGSWGWLLGRGASILQTDYLTDLGTYLHRKGLRDNPPSVTSVNFDFRDGTLQGWQNAKSSPTGATTFVADTGTYGDRTPGVRDLYKIVHTPFLTGRDTYHQTLLLRSPEFHLHGLKDYQAIGFSLLGGIGGSAAAPSSDTLLPLIAKPAGFLGLALRRSRDGAYLLSARRNATGQGQAWQAVTWDAATLRTAIANDQPDENYTLDLIDAFGPDSPTGTVSWGWVALDAVTYPWTGPGDPTTTSIRTFDLQQMALEWSSYPGFTYQVYRSPDLSPDGWSPVSEPLPATPPLNQFIIPASSLSPHRGFFRVESGDTAE